MINVDYGYVFRLEDLVFTPTAIAGIRLFNEAGYLAIVVTNQSGVARGLYGTADIERFHDALQERLREAGAWIDAFYYCPYHPDGSVEAFRADHEDRKPRPGMLLRAMRDFAIDRENSILIGDKGSDLEVAAAARIVGVRVEPNTCDLAAEAVRILDRRRGGRRHP